MTYHSFTAAKKKAAALGKHEHEEDCKCIGCEYCREMEEEINET